jgi:hypothetical protein
MAEQTAAQRVPFSIEDYMSPTERQEFPGLRENVLTLNEMARKARPDELARVQTLQATALAMFNKIYQAASTLSAAAEQNFARRDYRISFGTVSLGTEEELPAYIRMGSSDWNLFGNVTRTDGTEVLVQITKDLELQESPGVFTIELRTTPIELADDDGWDRRVSALRAAISAIEQTAIGSPLVTQEIGANRVTIFNPGNALSRIDGGRVQGTSKHATVGIPGREIGTRVTVADRTQLRKVHPYLTLPWYAEPFTGDPGLGALDDREKVGYALVMSAILKLAQVWTRHPGGLNLLAAKTMWEVLPKTPPAQILAAMGQAAHTAALAAIRGRAVPDWAANWGAVPSAQTWGEARDHILGEGHMGGHAPAASTVGGHPAMVFEYRANIPDAFAHAWWRRV